MKSIVRNDILFKLNSLSPDEKHQLSKLIQNHLHTVFKNETGTWGAYKSLGAEPKIDWDKVSSQISWAFPKIENEKLEFYNSAGIFKKSYLGFLEPEDGKIVNIKNINGFVIPAVAYDTEGHRLGRGKGFYDQALAEFTGKKIGVCFNMSLCEELPRERHDIKCELIVTENQIYKVNEAEGVKKWK